MLREAIASSFSMFPLSLQTGSELLSGLRRHMLKNGSVLARFGRAHHREYAPQKNQKKARSEILAVFGWQFSVLFLGLGAGRSNQNPKVFRKCFAGCRSKGRY